MSNHEAYNLLTPADINDWSLPQKSLQIESFTTYEDKILIGTQKGQLLLYSFTVKSRKKKDILHFEQIDVNWNFSKKPITQIEVVPENNLVFSLSDNVISVNDLSQILFPLVFIASKTKGAYVFVLDKINFKSQTNKITVFIRICVAVKRTLQFYFWKNSALEKLATDIEMNDMPRTLAWIDNTVCVGFKADYVLYNVSGEKTELFPTSSSRNIDPFSMTFDCEIFGVTKDDAIIAIDPNNYKQQDKQIKKEETRLKKFKALTLQTGAPQMFVYDEPYIIALINNDIEVHVLEKSGPRHETIIQTLKNFNKPKFLKRVNQGMLLCSSDTEIWGIKMVDIDKQRKQILKCRRFELAVQLTNISNDPKEDMLKQIQTHLAYDYFNEKKFEESINEFVKLNRSVIEIIDLFPNLLLPENKPPKIDEDEELETAKIKLESDDLEKGLVALTNYLTTTRHSLKGKMQNEILEQTGKEQIEQMLALIDTTLLKCYLQTNDLLVAPLLRLNYCILEESEMFLIKYHKFGELIILYQTKGHHKKALEVLKNQAQVTHSSLFGPERTVQYLQQLGKNHKQLIFTFSKWVLDKYPEEGLKIFTEDIQEVENLPRTEVLDFLLKHYKKLVTPYLEHLIKMWGETKLMFHHILIQEYCEQIAAIKDDKKKTTLLELVRAKLQDHLKHSKYYHPKSALLLFPATGLLDERALIYMRQENHLQALVIYVQILGNTTRAIEYCNEVFEENRNSKNFEVYLILINILLNPPASSPYSGVPLHKNCLKIDIETVLLILDTYSTRVEPHKVLKVLPDNVPMWRLQKFLETSLKNHVETKRNLQILKNLYSAENLQLQEQEKFFHSQSTLMTDFTVCLVCGKKIGNKTAFVRYPNESIVHFACQK